MEGPQVVPLAIGEVVGAYPFALGERRVPSAGDMGISLRQIVEEPGLVYGNTRKGDKAIESRAFDLLPDSQVVAARINAHMADSRDGMHAERGAAVVFYMALVHGDNIAAG